MFNKDSIKCMKYIHKHKQNINNGFQINEKSEQFINTLIKTFKNTHIKSLDEVNHVEYVLDKTRFKNSTNVMFDLFKELHDKNLLDDYLVNCGMTNEDKNKIKMIIDTNDLNGYINWFNMNNGILAELSPNKYKSNKVIYDILSFINTPDDEYSHINKIIYWNHFMPIDIQLMVQEKKLYLQKYIYGKITVYYYCFENGCNKDKILNIINICNFYCTYVKYKGKLTINVLLTDFKKLIDIKQRQPQSQHQSQPQSQPQSQHKILTSKHINSGACLIDMYINLWRDEEIYKVLFHELTHYFKIDTYTNASIDNKFNKQISKIFNNIHYYKPAEAYTESVAILLNCVYIIYKLNLNPKQFLKIFSYEYNFTLFQVAKLMKYYDIDNFHKIVPSELNKYTAIFSYYVIKLLIMHNFTMFMDFIMESIYFGDRVELIIKIIEKSLKDTEFHNNINYYYNIVNIDDKFINRTLRMSCVELL